MKEELKKDPSQGKLLRPLLERKGYGIKPNLDKDTILRHISEEEIFEYYGKVPVVYGRHFRSPLRKDNNPTCTFKRIGDKLMFRDWAEDKHRDCFSFVHKILGHTDFNDTLQAIYADIMAPREIKYIRKKYANDKTPVTVNTIKGLFDGVIIGESKDRRHKNKQKAIINVKISKRWQKEASEYLKSYHITSHQVKKYNVFPIEKVWINSKLIWTYSRNDPAIGYYFGKDEQGKQKWKIYFFARRKRHLRFMGNTNRINGWVQMPENDDIIIITKSLKDIMVLDVLGFNSIAMQNEVTTPYDYIIDKLKRRFKYIISFYDFDLTGIKNANKLRKLYSIQPIFLTNGRFGTKDHKYKDISDYIKAKGEKDAKRLVENYINICTKGV